MQSERSPVRQEDRVLVLASDRRDGDLICIALADAGMSPASFSTLPDLCEAIGQGAGCALIADEMLSDPALGMLTEVIDRQPDWSDFPLLIVTAIAARSSSNQRLSQVLHRLGNAVLLDRPLRLDTLVSTVRIALRGRRRQYQIRHHLAERDAAGRLQRFLIDFNDAMRSTEDPAAIAATAATAIGRHLGVACVQFCEVGADGDALTTVGVYRDGAPSPFVSTLSELPARFIENLRRGRHIAVDHLEHDESVGDEAVAGAMLAVPLLRDGSLIAVLLLTYRQPHHWSSAELLLLDRTAERTWLAVERALAEQALRESEENLRLALLSGPMIVFKQDAALRYTWVAGLEGDFLHERMFERTDSDILAPEYAEPLIALKRSVIATGVPARKEVVVLWNPKGSERCYDLVLEPIREGVTVVGLRGAAIDITLQHRTKLALEQALLAKSRFLAAASHDLRQPFQAMRLFLHILMNRLSDPNSLKVGESLLAAMESGEALLHALLDVSTLEAGTVNAVPTRFDVAQLVERLAAEFQPLAAENGLELRSHLRPAIVDTDPILLERILRNLLANALRYTPTGGILVASRRRNGTVRIEVWDTGPGIPRAELQSIFEEFYQVGNAERDRRKGLGLGLAIVERLARLLGIGIDVRSRVGRGSVFAVSIPLASPSPLPEPPPLQTLEALSGTSILIIDDDPLQLRSMKLMLEEYGCKVAAALDEEEALGHARRKPPPQIILSDLRLRGNRTGYQTVERIRRVARTTIPAIILTGETGPAYLASGDQPGYRLLHKPIDPARLARAILDMLGRK